MTGEAQALVLRSEPAWLELLPALGGAISRYASRVGDRTIDWLRPARANIADPEMAACFPLVPFSNRVRQGRFLFRGREVVMPLAGQPGPHAEHGFGWRHPWEVVRRAPDRAVFEYRHAAGAWPFPFRARQLFHLGASVLAITLEVANVGAQAMPLGFGLHPYFPRTPLCRLTAPVDGMWRVDGEIMPVELQMPAPVGSDPTNGLMPTKVSLDNGFVGWSGTARIEWPESSAALTIEADAPLRFLVVYSPAAEPYFCVEPVSHCTDAFNLAAQGRPDTGMIVLEPGRSIAATVRFTTVIEQH